MGIFYTNITLYPVNQEEVVRFLQKRNRKAYVSPQANGFVVVYDQKMDEMLADDSLSLASSLSSELNCAALAAVVIDADVFIYWLYQAGQLIDEYDSCPGYYDDSATTPSGGDARKLCMALGAPQAIKEVEAVFDKVFSLEREHDIAKDYLIGDAIHAELTEALKMPSFAVSTGFYTIEIGEAAAELSQLTVKVS